MEEQPLPPYSAFGINEKRCIVALVAYAAWFSTTSSFIYYPAIPLLSKALGVSVDSINLTVTSYMAVAMFAPTLVGDAADQIGRRPVYVATLSLYASAPFPSPMASSQT
ncbi:Major facilitator superfamily transporter [Cordyceps militaris CM01]|uniref:Major facilitator superfamily transporter n=1 Tax=Cordyceps militaris (strain CM01) TaxID=983644 RepID=G3J792_CORMM|nr:Major facilitator superfamily transporter [Cordyceps militaris CM01]EGX95465.1 Major facilitator superfamily transporter [Cordyceps militaris CM01]